jgi:DNA-binding NarL/FixJ family response regulator
MKNLNNKNYNPLTTQVLEQLGNIRPSKEHIELVETLLLRSNLNSKLVFHKKLTQRESGCLLLAAKGRTIEETAKIMKVKPSTVKTWRKQVINKLDCASMTQAIYEGISFGYIPNKVI